MFDDAYSFMEEFLTRDLDDDCLTDDNMWEGIRSHPSIQHAFPLPASNTPAGKRFRVAIGVTIYGRALAKHVWRPTYIAQDNELDKALDALGYQDPLHEAYLRAVLLKVLPERQTRCKDACVRKAVTDVVDGVAGLVPAEHRDAFEARLKIVSSKICSSWSLVQKLEEKVEPNFSLFNACHEGWRSLPALLDQRKPSHGALQTPPQTAQGRPRKPDANGQTATSGEGVARVVWPAFVYMSSQLGGETLLQPGYTLTLAQMAEADTDVSRRASRRTKRQNDAAGPGRRRRDSGIFLSSGGSNGSGSK